MFLLYEAMAENCKKVIPLIESQRYSDDHGVEGGDLKNVIPLKDLVVPEKGLLSYVMPKYVLLLAYVLTKVPNVDGIIPFSVCYSYLFIVVVITIL